MARRKKKTRIHFRRLRPNKRDLRLATAIADAVGPKFELLSSTLDRKFDEMKSAIGDVRDEVRQLRESTVGVGRMAKLEARVDAIERQMR